MREVIVDLDRLRGVFPSWRGLDFAFDTETSGVAIHTTDRPVGVSLTFADDRSYYLVLEHAQPGEHRRSDESGRLEPTAWPVKEFLPKEAVTKALNLLFGQEDVVMVGHHAKFDLHALGKLGVSVEGRLADTMLAAHLIDENRDLGLKELGTTLLGMDLLHYQELPHYPGWARDDFLGVEFGAATTYAMLDTEATWALWQRFRVEMVEEGVDGAFRDCWMPLLPVLQQMEAKGVALDLDIVRQVKAEYEAVAATHARAIWLTGIEMVLADRLHESMPQQYTIFAEDLDESYEIDPDEDEPTLVYEGVELPVYQKWSKNHRPIGKPRVPWFKVGSDDHVERLLFGHVGLRLPEGFKLKMPKSGGMPVHKDALIVMRREYGAQAPAVLDHILKWRQASKFISTYLKRYLSDADPSDFDCIRTWFNQHVTDTGRLSSSGPNLQNQPSRGPRGKQARSMFVPRPDRVLIAADYSMMELRLWGHYSGDPTLISAFAEGRDLHTLTATQQFGVGYDELAALIAEGDVNAALKRSIAKTSNFGLLYGMAAPKFQVYLGVNADVWVSREEAGNLIGGFESTFPVGIAWREEVVAEAKRLGGYIETMGGRKRRLPNLFSRDRWLRMEAERQGVNAKIQGSCADIFNTQIPPIQRALREYGGYCLLQIHDELVCEVPERYAEEGRLIVQTLMTEGINDQLRCPLKVDAHVGYSWGSAKG